MVRLQRAGTLDSDQFGVIDNIQCITFTARSSADGVHGARTNSTDRHTTPSRLATFCPMSVLRNAAAATILLDVEARPLQVRFVMKHHLSPHFSDPPSTVLRCRSDDRDETRAFIFEES